MKNLSKQLRMHFFRSEKKGWGLCLFGSVFMEREGHDSTAVDWAKRESTWSMVKVRPFHNISIYAKCNRGAFTGNPSLGWYVYTIDRLYMKSEPKERSGREKGFFFFFFFLFQLSYLIEKHIVVQCFLTANLTVSGEGESSSCPICQCLEYEKIRASIQCLWFMCV